MKSPFRTSIVVALVAISISLSSIAQEGYVPTAENLENREWFQDAKYGLFVHWGVYSIMGGGGDQGIAEWIMERKNIPIVQYEKLPGFFNPVEFKLRFLRPLLLDPSQEQAVLFAYRIFAEESTHSTPSGMLSRDA